jgi:hypothetical protein
MDIDIVGNDPTTPINVASMYAPNGPHLENYAGRSFQSCSACSSSKGGIHGLSL